MNIKYLNIFLNLVLAVIISIFAIRCANPGSPMGGPKDTTPPTLLKAEPPLFTKNFTADKIRLYFDEFISLKDVQSQMIISPPMIENPQIRIKGKSVIIEFNEKLKDSTTYNIFLGDAVVDITENNPYSNFRYVFSTGNVLDSMTYKGSVQDAFTLEPVQGTNVMLYLDNNDTIPFDSLPYFIRPFFMSRTNESGEFVFNNLANKSFKIFALEDGNSNLLFDQALERIAFSDSLIKPYYIPLPTEPDTSLKLDSLSIDTVLLNFSDSLDFSGSLDFSDSLDFKEPELLKLCLFEENDSIQKFLKATLAKKNHLVFIFRKPTISPVITPLNLNTNEEWKLEDINKTKDTLTFWIYNNLQDSITFEISDNDIILDTIEVAMVKKSKRRGEQKEDEKPAVLKVNFAKTPPVPDPESSIKTSFSYPVASQNLEGIQFMEDTNMIEMPDLILIDEIRSKAQIKYNWQEATAYSLLFPDSVFTDITGQSHDTLKHSFRVKSIADFGNLFFDISVPESKFNYIFQLLNKEKIITEYIIDTCERLSFKYLLPGDYQVKVIFDRNNNNQWDTGDYIYGIQPEEVRFFDKVITARANWDIEETWDLSE
ncbi:MAG: Ig-like domain-containing protein [Bacteroidales bacterium]|nr:Ig-like domain-containing protein [Bacteroidales bacterium]